MNPNRPSSQPASDPCAVPAGLLSVSDARARIDAFVTPLEGEEQLPIRSALNRVLAQSIVSNMNVPPYANSAMDGYAVCGQDLPTQGQRRLQLIGRALAGTPYNGRVASGQAVRIMTGAAMPEGADTVIMQEAVKLEADQIEIGSGHSPGENVRHAGEDMTVGDAVLNAGKQLLPAELGVLASLGIAEVRVKRRLRVAFFSTGDELRSLGEPLAPGQIYDSNRYTLHGMLSRLGVDILDLGVIPDRPEAVRRAFQQADRLADVVITSGGVSVGDADYVKQTLDAMGQVDFWKIAMKPGKPLAFGRLQQAVFFGLPGNPVSVMATFYQFAQPALQKMMGITAPSRLSLQVPCRATLKKQVGRLEYQRGVLTTDEQGNLQVTSTGQQGSHLLTSMSRSNCFIILPAECGGVQAGDKVEVQPFAGLI